MKDLAASIIYLAFGIAFLLPSPVVSQESPADSVEVHAEDLMKVEGTLVCVAEQMAKLRDKKPNCAKYGHVVGLRVSDGTIWSFYPNPEERKLRKRSEIGKRVRLKGKLFYSGKIIEIKEFEFLTDEEASKSL